MSHGFFRLAMRNVLRHKRRSLITLLTICIGLIALITVKAILEGSEREMIDNLIRTQTGHIRINARGYGKLSGDLPLHLAIPGPGEVKNIIREYPVSHITSRIRFGVTVSTGEKTFDVIGIGVEPQRESQISNLLNVVEGRELSKQDTDGVLVGEKLASALGVSPNDKLTLVVQTPDGVLNADDLKVAGLVKTGFDEYDTAFIFINLLKAQELLCLGDKATEIIALIDQPKKAVEIALDLTDKFNTQGMDLEAYPWQQLLVPVVKLWELFKRVTNITNMFVLIAVAASIINTLSMAVSERTREIGIMMAMGTKKRQILRLFLLEGLILGVSGAILGCILGAIVTQYYVTAGISAAGVIARQFLPMGEVIHAYLSPFNLVFSFIAAFIVTLLAASIPAYRAARLQPVEALRFI